MPKTKARAHAKPAKPQKPAGPDWGLIREEYENTMISLRGLASRYGITAENTIRRRRDSEGWTRDPEAIARNVVAEAVALRDAGGDPPPVQNVRTPAPNVRSPEPCAHRPPEMPEKQVQDLYLEQTEGLFQGQDVRSQRGGWTPISPLAGPAAAAARAQASGKGVVRAHAEATTRHLALADRMARAGCMVSDTLEIYLTTDDHVLRNRAANLLMLSDKDGLGGAMDRIVRCMGASIKEERLALAMDGRVAETGNGGGSRVPAHVERLLSEMPLDLMMYLRQAALEATRARPTIEADVPDADTVG